MSRTLNQDEFVIRYPCSLGRLTFRTTKQSARGRKARPTRVLRCEALERRELLSAAALPAAISFSGFQGASAEETGTLNLTFNGPPTVQPSSYGATIALAGVASWQSPGDPTVPVETVTFLLPPGTSIKTGRAKARSQARAGRVLRRSRCHACFPRNEKGHRSRWPFMIFSSSSCVRPSRGDDATSHRQGPSRRGRRGSQYRLARGPPSSHSIRCRR